MKCGVYESDYEHTTAPYTSPSQASYDFVGIFGAYPVINKFHCTW